MVLTDHTQEAFTPMPPIDVNGYFLLRRQILPFIIFLLSLHQTSFATSLLSNSKVLSQNGAVLGLLIADLDHDGIQELIALERRGNFPAWTMYLTIQPLLHKNVLRPIAIEVACSDCILVDIGRSENLEYLFIVKSDGLYVLSLFPSPQLKQLLSIPLLSSGAELGDISMYDFVRDIDQDGKDEILLFSGLSLLLYRYHAPERVTFLSSLRSPMKHYHHASPSEIPLHRHSALKNTTYLPFLDVLDLDGDHISDLVFLSEDELWFFKQSQEGWSKEPVHRCYNVLDDWERTSGEADLVPQLFDLDGDGRVDFLVNKLTGSPLDQHLRTLVFWGKDRLPMTTSSTLLERSHTSSSAFAIPKGNSPKSTELVLTQFNTGIFSIIRALVSKSIIIDFSFFPLGKHRSLSKEPRNTLSLRFSIDLQTMRLDGFLPSLNGILLLFISNVRTIPSEKLPTSLLKVLILINFFYIISMVSTVMIFCFISQGGRILLTPLNSFQYSPALIDYVP